MPNYAWGNNLKIAFNKIVRNNLGKWKGSKICKNRREPWARGTKLVRGHGQRSVVWSHGIGDSL